MQSRATTVDAYLAELPPDRRSAVEAVRKVILKNIDRKGIEEGMQYGMIGYAVPHRVFPDGYHCDPKQPLMFAALASQKNHVSLYMMALYFGCTEGEKPSELVQWFHDAWKQSGKKLDMGRACIRFKKIEDVPLDVIGEAIRRVPAKSYVDAYLKLRDAPRMTRDQIREQVRRREEKKSAAKKSAAGAGKSVAGAAKKSGSKSATRTSAKSAAAQRPAQPRKSSKP